MSIGKMRDRINVSFMKKIDNGRGGWTLEEEAQGEYWGEVLELSARNIIQYRQADMNVNTEIRMRSNDKINRHCILYARGNRYLIEEITEKPKGFYIIMAVGERIAE
jgi:head-tail adaptor